MESLNTFDGNPSSKNLFCLNFILIRLTLSSYRRRNNNCNFPGFMPIIKKTQAPVRGGLRLLLFVLCFIDQSMNLTRFLGWRSYLPFNKCSLLSSRVCILPRNLNNLPWLNNNLLSHTNDLLCGIFVHQQYKRHKKSQPLFRSLLLSKIYFAKEVLNGTL